MDRDVVVATIGPSRLVVIGQPNVWPSLTRVLVNVSDSKSWSEDDVPDAGNESLRALAGRAKRSRGAMLANDAAVIIIAMTVVSPCATTSMASHVKGVSHVVTQPESAMY